MSFECRFLANDFCTRLNKTCKPGQNGCVLQNKVKFISPTNVPDTGLPDSSPQPLTDKEPHQPH